MADLLEYKCPCCGGALEFDSASQKMKCPYCDTEFEMETLKALDDALKQVSQNDQMDNWSTSTDNQWAQDDTNGLKSYVCNSCGGEIIGDENTGATSCPYCDNPVVISDSFAGTLKPDLIIPFALDKKAAKEALSSHLQGKKLLPKVFKRENHIDEIKGIYVPFWMFDASVDGTASYEATKVRRWSDSDYDYTETSHYDIFRAGGMAFNNIPVDASSKMADDLMDSLEPFDFSKAVDFQTAYFAGYLADKYDVTVDESIPRINARVKQSTEDSFKTTISNEYTTVSIKDSYINLTDGHARYALLPIWIMNTSWKGEKYTFAMNGQTGKFVGNLPMDKRLYRKYFAISFALFGVIGAGLGYLANLFFA